MQHNTNPTIFIFSEDESFFNEKWREKAENEFNIIFLGIESTVSKLYEKIEKFQPHIVLIDLDIKDSNGFEIIRNIKLKGVSNYIYSVSSHMDESLMKGTLIHGGNYTLKKPFQIHELVDSIQKLSEINIQSEKIKQDIEVIKTPYVITLFSAKGGVGKTSIAVNLASSLVKKGQRCAILDLDLQFGDVTLFYDLTVKKTIVDLIPFYEELDSKNIEEFLISSKDGVKVLPSPLKLEEYELINEQLIYKVIDTLKEGYDFIIIDTSSFLNDQILASFDKSNIIFIVQNLNLSVLKNNKNALSILKSLYSKEKIRYILNRCNSKNGLTKDYVEKLCDSPIYWEIENNHILFESSINSGIPFSLNPNKNIKVKNQIEEMASELIKERITGKLSSKKENKTKKKFLGLF